MENDTLQRQALFAGLVYNEEGQSAELAYIGGVAHYVINDAGFLRHVESSRIDNQVLADLKARIGSMQGDIVRGILQMLGKDDILTKAALDASIRNLEQNVRQSDPNQWGPWLRLFGFRVVVDVHGQVLEVVYPTGPDNEE